jgi:hypothetical protein
VSKTQEHEKARKRGVPDLAAAVKELEDENRDLRYENDALKNYRVNRDAVYKATSEGAKVQVTPEFINALRSELERRTKLLLELRDDIIRGDLEYRNDLLKWGAQRFEHAEDYVKYVVAHNQRRARYYTHAEDPLFKLAETWFNVVKVALDCQDRLECEKRLLENDYIEFKSANPRVMVKYPSAALFDHTTSVSFAHLTNPYEKPEGIGKIERRGETSDGK